MTLKQLEAFYWAATSASFMVAAERLHLSQSSLSKRISELEQQFGRALFDRSGHRATLTEAGALLLPKARSLLAAADELKASLADEAAIRGHCRFGVGEQSSLTWLPEFVARARALFPNLALEPSVDIGSAMEAQVDGGLLDFAVIAGRSARPAIASARLADVQFFWAGAAELVGPAREVTADLLARAPLITMPSGAGATRIVEDWLRETGAEPVRRLACNSMAAIAGLVKAGVGVSCFPEQWLAQMTADGSVVRLTSAPALPPLAYFLHWRRDDGRPHLRRLRELVQDSADFSRPNALWAA